MASLSSWMVMLALVLLVLLVDLMQARPGLVGRRRGTEDDEYHWQKEENDLVYHFDDPDKAVLERLMKELESSDALQDFNTDTDKNQLPAKGEDAMGEVGVSLGNQYSYENQEFGETPVDEETSSEALQISALEQQQAELEQAVNELKKEVDRLIQKGADVVYPRREEKDGDEGTEEEAVHEEGDMDNEGAEHEDHEETANEEGINDNHEENGEDTDPNSESRDVEPQNGDAVEEEAVGEEFGEEVEGDARPESNEDDGQAETDRLENTEPEEAAIEEREETNEGRNTEEETHEEDEQELHKSEEA